jgi:Flp pilus assembly pilin Flp
MHYFWKVRQFLVGERKGVTALEYAFIGAVVAAVMVVGATTLGISLSTDFLTVAGRV